MDIINICLNIAPVPGLSASFTILKFIASTVQQVQASKLQLVALATSTAQLLDTLNAEYTSGRLSPNKSGEALDNLERWVLQRFLRGSMSLE